MNMTMANLTFPEIFSPYVRMMAPLIKKLLGLNPSNLISHQRYLRKPQGKSENQQLGIVPDILLPIPARNRFLSFL